MRIATAIRGAREKGVEWQDVKQCAVLFVNPERVETTHPAFFRAAGFLVREAADWLTDDRKIRDYHAVVVHVCAIATAPMLAARLRAKPHFGRRLLVALVHAETPLQARLAARASGFDEVVNENCASRRLAARMLRGLRARPELRCALPPLLSGRSAA